MQRREWDRCSNKLEMIALEMEKDMPVESPCPSTSCCTRVYEEFIIVFNGLKPRNNVMRTTSEVG